MRASLRAALLVSVSLFGCRDWSLGGLTDPTGLLGSGGSGAGVGAVGAGDVGGAASAGAAPVGPAAPSNDTCDGAADIDLAAGEHAFAHGTFSGANADHPAFCAGVGAPDIVYRLNVLDACSAVITADGGAEINPVIAVRSYDCEAEEFCADREGPFNQITLPLTAGTYWVLLLNRNGGGGDVTLSVDCLPPRCGDAILNEGETCDDGNEVAGDGCADCALEPPIAEIDTCAGASAGPAIVLTPASTTWVPDSGTRSTVNATDSGTGSCFYPPGVDGTIAARDHVYRVQVTAPTIVRAVVGDDLTGSAFCGVAEPSSPPYPTGCWDYAVSVRESVCDDPAGEVACAESEAWWAVESASFHAQPGLDYFVFVDGWHDDEYGSGPYVLRLETE